MFDLPPYGVYRVQLPKTCSVFGTKYLTRVRYESQLAGKSTGYISTPVLFYSFSYGRRLLHGNAIYSALNKVFPDEFLRLASNHEFGDTPCVGIFIALQNG